MSICQCRVGRRLAVVVWFCLCAAIPAEQTCVCQLPLDGAESLGPVEGRVRGGTWVSGRTGNAWRAGGGEDRIALPSAGRFTRDSGTIEMFFMVDEPIPDGATAVLFDCLGKPNWWNRFCGTIRRKDGKASLDFVIVANKSVQFACDARASAAVDIQPGVWHHYAATWRGVGSGKNDGEMRLFLDGIEIARLCDQSLPVTNLGPELWIGNAIHKPARAKAPVAVALDDVRVWGAVLSAAELACRGARMPILTDDLDASVSALAIRPLIEPPVMDGNADDKAWQYAQALTGFRDYHRAGGPIVPLQVTTWLAYDEDNLYAAWRCELAARRPVGAERPQDGPVFNDESIELLFLSPAKPGVLFHFIGNAYGSIYDERFRDGERDRSWTGPWEYHVNVVPAHHWDGELRIPLRELGLSTPLPGELWRVNVAHNGFEPQCQSIWSHTTTAYADREALGRMLIAGPGPVISGLQIPGLVVGENRVNVRYAGTTEEPRALLLTITAAAPGTDPARTLWRRHAGAETARTDATRLTAPTHGVSRIAVKVVDEASELVMYHHTAGVNVSPPLAVTVTGQFPDGVADVDVDARNLDGAPFSGTTELRSRDGSVLAVVAVPEFRGTTQVRLPLTDVPAGDRQVMVRVTDSTGTDTTRTVPFTIHPEPDCSSETAGVGGVVPPWTPLRVRDREVHCWGRVYTFADGPFPSSLVSAGEDILIKPPRFAWRAGAQRGELGTGTLRISESSDSRVAFSGRMTDELFQVDCSAEIEFDGAVFYEMTITPTQPIEKLDEFALEFMLKPDAARFFLEGHAEHVSPERNVLPSQPGERVATKFLPMAALCGDERGLQWFCQSDEGWTPYDRTDTMVMERKEDALLWRFNIKQGGSFTDALHLRWGFLATPVKPLARTRDHQRVVHFWPGGPVRATPEAFYRPQILDKVAAYGGKVITLHSYWSDVFGSHRPYDTEKFRAFVDKAHGLGIRVTLYLSGLGHPDYPDALYYGDRWPVDPRTGFKSRTWERKEIGSIVRCAGSKSFRDWLCGGVERLLRELGADGLYYDWGCGSCRNHLHGCGYLPTAGSSLGLPEVGDEELILGMAVQSLAGPWAAYRRTTRIRAQRELWQRLYRIVKDVCGPDGSIIAHSDVPSHVVYTGFTDGIWHSEDVACHMPRDWIPEPWYYRIFMSKRHLGLDSELLTMINGKFGPWETQEKGLAISLVHNEWPRPRSEGLWGRIPEEATRPIADVWKALDAFGADSAEWRPYWRNREWVTSDDATILVSYWRKPDRALFCIANWSNEAKTATIAIKDGPVLAGTARDALTGESLQLSAGRLTCALDPARMRLVTIESEKME